MAGIKSLRLQNVRSHTAADFQFNAHMNAIVGPNGSGKTTVIEALYTLLHGSSFKGTLSELAQYGQSHFRLQIEVKSAHTVHGRSLAWQQTEETVQKKWLLDSKNYSRLPLATRLPVVLFEPDLARLITGSPDRRRSYLDQIAGQLDLEVASLQNRFERTLKQRNQLLKQLRAQSIFTPPDELFVWNTQLARLSQRIVSARINLVQSLQKEIGHYYQQLGGSDTVVLSYQSSVSEDPDLYANQLLQFLETSVARDIALGHTSFGPHRDDLIIHLADQPAEQRASRGEIRTLVIALKLLETKILSDHFKASGVKPILLLDDVLSELDLIHQERVLAGFKGHQVFITTTDAHALTPGVHTIALG